MSKKIVFIVGFIIVAIIIAGVFLAQKRQEMAIEQERAMERQLILQQPEISEKVDTSDWKTYRNDEFGFEVKYANDWIPKEFYYYNKDLGKGVCFGEMTCLNKNDITGNCDNYTCISMEDLVSFKKNHTMEIPSNPKITGMCRKYLSQLNFSESLPGLEACRMDTYGYVWDYYYFTYNNLGYVMTIRHEDPNYDPKIERAIMESFKFIKKK